jgi:hypothetical protein
MEKSPSLSNDLLAQKSKYKKVLYFLILCLPIIAILTTKYNPRNGYLELIMFGKVFKDRRLDVIDKIDPPTLTEWGYDGQMYAQLAIDPLLLQANKLNSVIDGAAYRARRIGMPFMAYILGGGIPEKVIHVFSILNLLFWLGFLILLYKFVGVNKFIDFQLAASLLWTTGTLTSITRSLIDFPAVVMIMISIWINSWWLISSLFFSYSILVKETGVLGLLSFIWPLRPDRVILKINLIKILIILWPPFLWFIYVSIVFPKETISGLNVFALPFLGISLKVKNAFNLALNSSFTLSSWPLFQIFYIYDFICPLSFLVQSVYLLRTPRFESNIWRMGIGFCLLLFFLGHSVWNDQYAYSRVLLPLTYSFNFLIHENEKKLTYAMWFVLGNIGLSWGLVDTTYNFFEFLK